VVNVIAALKPRVKPAAVSSQGVVEVSTRQLFKRDAGITNLGSAFESTETVADAIAVPLVPNDWYAATGPNEALLALFVTVRLALRTNVVPEHVDPTTG
jgi:hypothetical protein